MGHEEVAYYSLAVGSVILILAPVIGLIVSARDRKYFGVLNDLRMKFDEYSRNNFVSRDAYDSLLTDYHRFRESVPTRAEHDKLTDQITTNTARLAAIEAILRSNL